MRFRLMLVLLLVVGAACGNNGASEDTSGASIAPTTGPTDAVATTTVDEGDGWAPWGLEAVVMPDSAAAVEAVFARLPSELAGLTRKDVQGRVEGALGVEYGDGSRAIRGTPLAAIPTQGDDELTPLAWLETMAGAMEGEVAGSLLEPNAPLVWIASAEQADDETAYIAVWCVPSGSWYFDAVAESAVARLELIEAFIAAVKSA
ncbi:MAG: hypothetical protein KJP22_02065 [Acidimicrobiia bacterium]|nr:hypothetical protein [Acidimicrobiia bacterium]